MARITDLPASARRSAVKGERPKGQWDEDQFTCSDTWIVPVADLNTFLTVAAGTPEDIGGVATRIAPLRTSEFDFAVATAIDWTLDGWSHSTNGFAIARVSIQYASPKYGDDYTSIDFSPDRRLLRTPSTIASGLADVPADGLAYNVTLHKLPSVPLETWRNAAGKINNNTWRGFPVGTVKFEGPGGSQKTNIGGVITYEATLTFRVSQVRWDYDYDATGTLVSTGVPASIDFASVFGVA